MSKSLQELQNDFHDAGTAWDRDKIRQEMRDLGFDWVASTIRTVDHGGVDARDEPTEVRPDEH